MAVGLCGLCADLLVSTNKESVAPADTHMRADVGTVFPAPCGVEYLDLGDPPVSALKLRLEVHEALRAHFPRGIRCSSCPLSSILREEQSNGRMGGEMRLIRREGPFVRAEAVIGSGLLLRVRTKGKDDSPSQNGVCADSRAVAAVVNPCSGMVHNLNGFLRSRSLRWTTGSSHTRISTKSS